MVSLTDEVLGQLVMRAFLMGPQAGSPMLGQGDGALQLLPAAALLAQAALPMSMPDMPGWQLSLPSYRDGPPLNMAPAPQHQGALMQPHRGALAAAAAAAGVVPMRAQQQAPQPHAPHAGGSASPRSAALACPQAASESSFYLYDEEVQSRIAHFPDELRQECCAHWQRYGSVPVVCNDMPGLLSVQAGRCVITCPPPDAQEAMPSVAVTTGVVDFLRRAGEARLKKWRRHVRVTGFARPGRRPDISSASKLMSVEEFLCLVGFQAAHGGRRKRPAPGDEEPDADGDGSSGGATQPPHARRLGRTSA